MRVTTADFSKHYGELAHRAVSEPLKIARKGHDRLVVLSADEYERLKRPDRRVVAAGDLTEAEVALIAGAEVPAEHAYLDDEMTDWLA